MTPSCPAWEYDDHPNRASVTEEISVLLQELANKQIDCRDTALNTKPVHGRIFANVVPSGYEYYAGNFRGEHFPCLIARMVMVNGDPRVGLAPEKVGYFTGELVSQLGAGIKGLDLSFAIPEQERLRHIIMLSSRVFVAFLTIHPYLNGNGHIARLIVWCLLIRYGYFPKKWTVDARPPGPYVKAITDYRDGNIGTLETLVLQSLT